MLDELDETEAGKKGLWENIRDKKRRMGKNYRPAQPGDKDRPSKEALEKAKKSSADKDEEKEDSKNKSGKDKNDKDKGLTEKQKKLPDFIKDKIKKK